MMARKTIEFLIKLFILALIGTAALYIYKVLDQMGVA